MRINIFRLIHHMSKIVKRKINGKSVHMHKVFEPFGIPIKMSTENE